MKYADTHAHLTWKSFDHDREEVISRAGDAGICLIIDCGIDRKSNQTTLEIASEHDDIYSTLGFQPSKVPETTKEQLDMELGFIEANLERAVALGEVGMDYHWVKDTVGRRHQKEFFERCCDISKERDMQLVVHSRKCESQCMDVTEKAGLVAVVMHCFSGSREELDRAVELGYMISIPTSVCWSRSHQRNATAVPDNLLLLETDCPFLSPRRGVRNEPAFIIEGYETVAGLRGCGTDELGNQVLENARRFFRLN